MLCFRFNNSHHLQADKKSIVSPPTVSNSRICRPPGNRYIPPFGRAGSFGKTKIFSIRFPAHLSELLIDQEARLGFRALTLAGCLANALAAAVFGDRLCLGCFRFGLLRQAGFLLLFCGLVCCPHLLRGNGHHEFMMLIIPVTIGLHEPFTEAMSHRQKRQTVCL